MKDHSLRVQLTTFPNISVMVYPSDENPGWWRVKSTIENTNSLTGEVESFEVPILFRHDGEPSTELLSIWVHEAVLAQLTHELDEGLVVDGKRLFDPHATRSTERGEL